MRKLAILILIILSSCAEENNKNIQIEIINKNIVSYGYKDECYDKNYHNNAGVIITYKITNYENSTFYFNLDSDGPLGRNSNEGFRDYRNLSTLILSDEKGKIVHFSPKEILPSKETNDLITYQIHSDEIRKNSTELSYHNNGFKREALEKANFIIHPNETLYFEFYLTLPMTENSLVGFIKGENYFASIELVSDSSNYKNVLSRPEIETIKKNNYKIFQGRLQSNKIPIKILDCQE